MSGNDSFYHKKRHKEWRAAVLKRDKYLCVKCRRYGRRMPNGDPVSAEVAHHILHADKYPELRYVVSNGVSLCKDCHNKEHPEKGRQKGYPAPSSY